VGPRLLFFGGEYDHAALLKQAAVAAGLTVPLMGGDGVQADGYIATTGASSEGDLASSVGAPVDREPGGPAFLAAYDAHGFDDPPSTFGPYAYDAANILLSAASRALAGRSRVDAAVRSDVIVGVQAISNAMLINARGAVTGRIGFDALGDTINAVLTLYRVESGQWVPVEP
jgi:branched-chain amino acid transport system substrate-binding protein